MWSSLFVRQALFISFFILRSVAGWLPDKQTLVSVVSSPATPLNLSYLKEVRASTLWPEEPAENAVDGEATPWRAYSSAPQWVEIDLQRPARITWMRLVTEQFRAGETVHQIWGAGPGEALRLLHEFRGYTENNQVLEFLPETPSANIQVIRVLTTVSPSRPAWREIEVYGNHDDTLPGRNIVTFDISDYAGQTISLELTAEGDDIDYAGMFVNAVQVQTTSGYSCGGFRNCEFDDMLNDTAWQKSGRLRYTNLAGERTESWWGNDHDGGFWHDASVSQIATLPADASTLVVEVCTGCLYSTYGGDSPTEYNARLSVKIDGRYLANHADPLPPINALPPFKNLALGQPVTTSRSWPEAPPANAVDGSQTSVWIAGSHPPQWIEVDLGQPAAVAVVRLVVEQYPSGETVHQIWGRGPDEALRLLHEFRGNTFTGYTLEFVPETPVADLHSIHILTTEGPSWVAWREIEVLVDANFDGTHDEPGDGRGDAEDEEPALPPGSPAPARPVMPSPAASEGPGENAAGSQPTVQLLYPELTGAFIELRAEPLRPGLWTRVQWQDALGSWHDIEGWQGTFNPDQRVLWYVGEEHLGQGRFRWLVYDNQEGDLLAASQPFSLPSRGGEVLYIEVSLPAPVKAVTVTASLPDAPATASTLTPWVRAHPVWDSVDAWNWPQDAVLHLTIDDPATLAVPDFEMDMLGEVDPDPGSVWFDFAGMYDLKPGDEVTLSDGTTTRQLTLSSLTIDAVDVAANTASGTAEAGASVRLPTPGEALLVMADSRGAWFADFHDVDFDLVAGTTVIAEVYDEDGDLTSFEWVVVIPLEENVAAARPVTVTTNGADDDRENPGIEPADITDGRLDYLAAGDALEDGVVGYVNDDLNQRMVITVTIDLQGAYDVSRIRYNMGNVQRAETWNADLMTTPFGTTPTNPGMPNHGVWTEHTGNATLSSVTIVLEKTRVSYATDWLFIGEIEVYGTPAN